jgi:hypothetical protein
MTLLVGSTGGKRPASVADHPVSALQAALRPALQTNSQAIVLINVFIGPAGKI